MKNFFKVSTINTLLSVSALDAVLISTCWHLYLSAELGSEFQVIHLLIVGISIWLGYMLDRLLDSRTLEQKTIQTHRHRFAKAHSMKLWKLWLSLLLLDIVLSLIFLSTQQIFTGLKLIAFVLIYTLGNQCFFRKYFPKELCVSILYAYGVLFLINPSLLQKELYLLASLCLFNCLLISKKEAAIDKRAQRQSIGTMLTDSQLQIGLVLIALIYISLSLQWTIYLAISLSLLVLTLFKDRINRESYRSLIESIFFIYPLLFLIF
jgi:hypothetical protein